MRRALSWKSLWVGTVSVCALIEVALFWLTLHLYQQVHLVQLRDYALAVATCAGLYFVFTATAAVGLAAFEVSAE